MLEEMSIRNYALIDSITLSFRSGFNVLTGETGAGKSIIVGSLSFLMGGKAEVDVIRTGCEEASVSAVVSINNKNTDVTDWLKSRDIECEEEADSVRTIIVRRNLKTSGRSSIYIQNIPVTKQDLTDFMGLLFDLHGQHNHESLLKKENHRRYLDRFAGIEDEVSGYSRTFLELTEKRKTLDVSLKSDREREERLELLSYAVDEIEKAAVKIGELRELENEAQKLSDFEKLIGFINTAADCIFDGDKSVLSLARKANNVLDSAALVDSSLGEINRRFENLYYEAEDITSEFRAYKDGLSFDPQRLEVINERLTLIYKLKKKYAKNSESQSSDEEAILSYKAQAEAEIEALSGAEENKEKLKTQIAALEKDVVARAQSLRQKRAAAALDLSRSVTGILKHLGMPNAGFKADIVLRQQDEKISFGPFGTEDVVFLISPNEGEPLKDLARIASGGELSRVMLSIKTALLAAPAQSKDVKTGADSVETLVFDEIDTGIGGEVALKVGDYLAQIGKILQIFCVTHLASIAVRADNHFKVEKRTEGGRTFTGIGPLSADGRKKEIARMLAGDAGEAALAHADELMAKYGAALSD
ncbi:MAG: DNA repair protein RecN [Treponema sp.]|jgi:DNA repair protein RecN (Recombination protein N)|nr:DNA repair protein RecN [Treponema sp.]